MYHLFFKPSIFPSYIHFIVIEFIKAAARQASNNKSNNKSINDTCYVRVLRHRLPDFSGKVLKQVSQPVTLWFPFGSSQQIVNEYLCLTLVPFLSVRYNVPTNANDNNNSLALAQESKNR